VGLLKCTPFPSSYLGTILLLILLLLIPHSCHQGESLDKLRSFSAYKAARFAPLPEEEEELDSEAETPVSEDR